MKPEFDGSDDPPSHIIGLDIGGANLKGASTDGAAGSETFEIWRAPGELAERLRALIARFPPADRIAVTMTAELADCFETKRAGIGHILHAVEKAAAGTEVFVWLTSGRFASPDEACERPREVAAANWHALATWAGRFAREGNGLLIDVGSTTTDIIPLRDGRPCPVGKTDVERLMSGELVYTGVRRTPVCAVAPAVPYRGRSCPLAAEWFATMLDVYLTLGLVAEDPADRGTANGRPATARDAWGRLARAVCCDDTEFSAGDAVGVAEFLAEFQVDRILSALTGVLENCEENMPVAVICGEGEFLARQVLQRHPATRFGQIVSLSAQLSPALAEAACAYAVAVLADTGPS